MTRNDWKDFFEVVGVISIVVTLAFVALEIRQNTDAVRSATIQDISRMSFDATALGVQHADLRAAQFAVCDGNVNRDQERQLRLYYASLMRIQMNRYYQVQLGILSDVEILALGGRGGAYRSPIFRSIWHEIKEEFPPDFRDYIERDVLPLSQEDC